MKDRIDRIKGHISKKSESIKQHLERVGDKSQEMLHRWEDKSREFITDFLDLFGRDTRLVSVIVMQFFMFFFRVDTCCNTYCTPTPYTKVMFCPLPIFHFMSFF